MYLQHRLACVVAPTSKDGDFHGVVAEPVRVATARSLHSCGLSHHSRPIPGQDRPSADSRRAHGTDGSKSIRKMNVPVSLPLILDYSLTKLTKREHSDVVSR